MELVSKVDVVAMSYKAWLALEQQAQQQNYTAYRQYYDGDHPTQLTERQRQYLGLGKSAKFCDNYSRTVVNALADRLEVSGFQTENKAADEIIANWWQVNRMDAVQARVHRSCVRDGDTYILVSWDNDKAIPRFTHHLALDGTSGIHAIYDDDTAEILFATKRWVSTSGERSGKRRRLNFYFANRVERYICDSDIEGGEWRPYDEDGEDWIIPWVDAQGLPIGVPVMHFRNQDIGDSYGLSELADVVPLQDALNKALIDYVAAADTTAFQMLFATGFDASSFVIAPGSLLWTTNPDASVGVLQASDMTGLRGILKDFVIEIAGVSQTPQYYFQGLSGEPPSGESLKTQETGLVAKARNRSVYFGNSWEDALYMAFKLMAAFGRQTVDPGIISTQWQDIETRNEKLHLEGLEIKQRLGVPQERIWSEMGYSEDEILSLRKLQEEESRRRETLGSMLLSQFERAGRQSEDEQGGES